MTDPFQVAWMILKNRGHSLDLHEMDETPSDYHSQPKTLDEHRLNQGNPTAVDRLMEGRQQVVDKQGENLRQFNHFDNLDHEPVHDYYSANDRFRHGNEAQAARGRLMDRMVHNEGLQDDYGTDIERQIQQDEQRLGQQGEADEMEAMGVEPMGRTLGATPPANIGQAGSTGGADPERYSINPFAMGEAMNTFRPPQELHGWASGVKPTARGSPKISDEKVESDIEAHFTEPPLQSNDSFGSEVPTTVAQTPRHERRGQEGAGRQIEKPKRPSWWRGE
tara:strand:+ start:458 stop:1291 length:834 start_codon:yes stop_codon:yes gene_type:complete